MSKEGKNEQSGFCFIFSCFFRPDGFSIELCNIHPCVRQIICNFNNLSVAYFFIDNFDFLAIVLSPLVQSHCPHAIMTTEEELRRFEETTINDQVMNASQSEWHWAGLFGSFLDIRFPESWVTGTMFFSSKFSSVVARLVNDKLNNSIN